MNLKTANGKEHLKLYGTTYFKKNNKERILPIMKDKFTMQLTWHNCFTCPPTEDFNDNLYISQGKDVIRVTYDATRGWYDEECNEYIPSDLLEYFWWADIKQTFDILKTYSTEE